MPKIKDKPKSLSIANISKTFKQVTRQSAQTKCTSAHALSRVTTHITEIYLGTYVITKTMVSISVSTYNVY